MTLKGNIVSTGGGKIIVSNGAADVSVTNNSNKNLTINKIESTESKGMVTIIDKAQNNKETNFSSDSTYTPAKGMSYKWTGGGNGNVNLIANHADYLDIITGGNISFSLGGKEGQSIMYIRNAIAGGKVDLTGYVTDFYRADDNAYISAGPGENIYITAKSLGNNFDKNTIGILANGANLMYNVNSSSTPIYLQAITRDGLQNKVYLRTLSETGRVGIERSRKVYFSPDNAFESSYFTY